MNEYNISDYSIFDNASSTTNNIKESFDNSSTEILACKEITSNESVFMGPIADDCNKTLDILNTSSKTVSDDFNTISQYLATVSSTYQKGDNDTLDAIMSISTSTDTTSTSVATMMSQYKMLSQLQTGGHIEQNEFTASNGIKMKYFLYVPEFSDGEHTNLPLCLYLHGDSGHTKGALSNSLPMLLDKDKLDVPGYILIPQSNHNGWWDNSKGANKNRDAAVELTRKIAQDKNVDMTRISACGHSNGGCGVHHMVAEHTDLFSCYVSSAGATGKNAGNEKIGQAKIYTWGLHGSKDHVVDYSNSNGVGGKETYERIAAINPEGTEFTTIDGADHYTQNYVWTTEYNYKGMNITPIEWLLTTKKYGT